MNLWSPFADENINDPYPMYERIRSSSPAFRTQTNEYIITNYEDVKSILKNKDDYIVGNGKLWLERGATYLMTKDIALSYISKALNKFILLLNPPEHQRIRRFVSEAWNNKEVQDIIEKNCTQLLDKIDNQNFDFISSFAAPLPAMTIADLMGINIKHYDQLQKLGSQMVKSLDFYLKIEDLVKIDEASKEFISFFEDHITSKPASGLLAKLIENNKLLDKPLSHEELISICIFLFVAGEETTVSLLSTGLLNLIQSGHWDNLTKNNVEAYVEELLRIDGPVHLLGRIAAKDTIIQNVKIKKDSTITLCLAAANRDPVVFDNALTININRKQKHLAFGNGNHYCLGDWLARQQASTAFRMLKEKYPHLGLSSNTFKWKAQLAIRRLEQLPIQVR